MRRIRAGWLLGIVFTLGLEAQAAVTRVKGRVMAADGVPVAGADVGTAWDFAADKILPFSGVPTDAEGRFEIETNFSGRPIGLLAMNADRTAGGWITVAPAQIADLATIATGPLVRVHGNFSCADLGKKPSWTNVYITTEQGDHRFAQCSSREATFDLKLPVGAYAFRGYGSQDVKQVTRKLDLKADQPDMDLGTIDLPASPLGRMYDKPAPPLHITDARGISPDMKLTDFKGKWVVLDFWGYWCGPCVGGSLPDLMQFWDEYPEDREKFVFLAFHDKQAANFTDLDKKLVPIVRDTWGGRELPFPILLDSTGRTVEEYGIRSWPTTILINPEGSVVRGTEQSLREHLPPVPMARRIPLALERQLDFGADVNPLNARVAFLAREARLPIQLDEPALRSAGVAPDAIVPLTLNGQLSLRSWLELALKPLGLVAVPAPDGLIVTTPRPDAPLDPEPSATQKRVAERIARKLGEPATFDLKNRSLAEIASYFGEATGENFVLDPLDRIAGRLDSKATASGKAEGTPLRDGLKALLAPLGIELVVRDEVVVMTKPATP